MFGKVFPADSSAQKRFTRTSAGQVGSLTLSESAAGADAGCGPAL